MKNKQSYCFRFDYNYAVKEYLLHYRRITNSGYINDTKKNEKTIEYSCSVVQLSILSPDKRNEFKIIFDCFHNILCKQYVNRDYIIICYFQNQIFLRKW